MRLRSAIVSAAVALVAAGAVVAVAPSPAGAYTPTPVLARKVIGYSAKHRPIVAYRVGNPAARTKAVLLGQMHGDEHAGVVLADSIIRGRASVEGIDLWVIPTMNPDGDAAGRRQNARKVDLNRNWPRRWAHLTGMYYSGPKALSEPETRAMYRFLSKIRPRYLVSLHQPLRGVDTTDGGAIDPAFRNRLARNLGLPRKAFVCWSTCRGSMTDWYTARRLGTAITVEFGPRPARSYLIGKARRGIIAAMGGRFGTLAKHNPRSSLSATVGTGGAVTVNGFAFDIDARARSVRFTATLDGATPTRGQAAEPSAAANKRYRLTGAHGITLALTAPPGEHELCLKFVNIAAGTGDPSRCVSFSVPAP